MFSLFAEPRWEGHPVWPDLGWAAGLESDDLDPNDPRLSVEVASVPGPPTRNFVYSPEMNLLAESELTYPREKRILYEYIWFNGHPVAQVDGTAVTHWTFTDHVGTPLIQTDAGGNVYWRAEYEPYGKVWAYNPPSLADQHQPLRLPGQDAEQLNLGMNGATERSYNVFRWYRSAWGRYTQSDPIGFRGGLNLYAYAQENPLRLFDPYGLACCPVECPGGYWTGTGYDVFVGVGPLSFNQTEGELRCASNGRSVHFRTRCGSPLTFLGGPKIIVPPPNVGDPPGRVNFAASFSGAGVHCWGAPCVADLGSSSTGAAAGRGFGLVGGGVTVSTGSSHCVTFVAGGGFGVAVIPVQICNTEIN